MQHPPVIPRPPAHVSNTLIERKAGQMARQYDRTTGGGAYSKADVTEAIAASTTLAGAMRRLGLASGASAYRNIRASIQAFELSTGHFRVTVKTPGKMASAEVLTRMPDGSARRRSQLLRRALLEIGRDESCGECGLSAVWNGKSIALDVDHVDGNHCNNLATNLRFLCPNCHSQQPTGKPWKNYVRPLEVAQTLHPEVRVTSKAIAKRDECACGQSKTLAARVCLVCEFSQRSRIEWPSPAVLTAMIARSSRIQVAADLGVDRKSLWLHRQAYPDSEENNLVL